MAECERLAGCPFFKNLEHLPKTAEQLVASYCKGDNSSCARLWVISTGVRPPDDLFPNESERALRILTKSAPPANAPPNAAHVKKASGSR